MGAKNLAPATIPSPDLPTRSESPHRRRYPGPHFVSIIPYKIGSKKHPHRQKTLEDNTGIVSSFPLVLPASFFHSAHMVSLPFTLRVRLIPKIAEKKEEIYSLNIFLI
jgi:hypothetical protein